MCVRDNYNEIHDNGSWQQISDFMDDCDDCPKTCGGCDYLGYLDDRLKELDGELEYCSLCGARISYNDGDTSTKVGAEIYCEKCYKNK